MDWHGAVQSNMAARGIFLGICVWQCPLKDGAYQLVIGTIPQRNWCPLQCNYVTDWLAYLILRVLLRQGP